MSIGANLKRVKSQKRNYLLNALWISLLKLVWRLLVLKEFNQAYLNGLLDTVVFMSEAYETVKKLHPEYKQYLVTNGVKQLQRQKIAKAHIEVIL